MLETGERIFGREYQTVIGAKSVSHLKAPTTFDVTQMYKRVKVLPTEDLNNSNSTDFLNTSFLKVENGQLTPIQFKVFGEGNEKTIVNQIDSIDDIILQYEPSGLPNLPFAYVIPEDAFKYNSSKTRICVENRTLPPISVNVLFNDIQSDPAWNGEPITFVYAHCCVTLDPDYYIAMDNNGDNYGGGMFVNLFRSQPAETWTDWTPVLCSTKISSRTVMIPLSYDNDRISIMVRGCKSWSIEFLAYVTGV